MIEVAGKVAFIAGGSSGIGLGIARAFAEAGMKVVVGYLTPEHRESALASLAPTGAPVHAIRVDVTNRRSVEQAAQETVATFGRVHVLVNSAGVVLPAPLSATTHDDWDWLMSVNVSGVFNGVHAFLPHIRAQGESGHVIGTASVVGLFVAGGMEAAYAASKFAVVGMMEALRAELAGTNIGVSIFCPGMVSSNLMNSSRSRPRHLADTPFERAPGSIERERALRANPDFNMDPLEVGRLVLQGMRRNDLYILTHSEFAGLIRERSATLLAAIRADLPQPTAQRLAMVQALGERSIYAAERVRASDSDGSCGR
jgi:NAD(P)-dependent dehydrogenase (short-subunit alcohol dehydrogenase family)